MYSLNNFDIQHFLSHYWQQKPLVIQQGFAGFIDPLDENELAGLSLDPNVDSRIVTKTGDAWQVHHGPFDDVNALCTGAWSLLVQSVDHYIPEADALMRAFDFIPHWRMDDLMVSFSNAKAGVGSHLDQYDVFIVQGRGSRRWQVGLPGDFEVINPHRDLSQITAFDPIIDQVLLPGDIIYIPANHPHNGTALEACLNYSVGFRAPSQQEMLSSLADFALDNNLYTARYSDNKIAPRTFSGEIKQQEVAKFRQMLHQLLETDQFVDWTAQFLSRNGERPELEAQEEPEFTHQEIQNMLRSGVQLIRYPAVKAVYVEQQAHDNQDFTFYLQGEAYSVPLTDRQTVIDFLNRPVFHLEPSVLDQSSILFTQLLTTLVNSGYWYPEDQDTE